MIPKLDQMVDLVIVLPRLMVYIQPEASVYERENRGMLELG